MKKQKFNDWLYRNDIGQEEFVVYCAMVGLFLVWIILKLLNP